MTTDLLAWLQEWYVDQTDGDWEHSFGVSIDTIDNPGWRVSIDLAEAILPREGFKPMRIDRSDNDWVRAKVENEKFDAAGGPNNLSELLTIFRDWIE